MNLRDEVLEMLKDKFSDVGFVFPKSETVIAKMTARHPALGELVIEDDGDEAIATIGEITHGHFYAFDRKSEHAGKEVAEHLGDFLTKLSPTRSTFGRVKDRPDTVQLLSLPNPRKDGAISCGQDRMPPLAN